MNTPNDPEAIHVEREKRQREIEARYLQQSAADVAEIGKGRSGITGGHVLLATSILLAARLQRGELI